jgi:transposase
MRPKGTAEELERRRQRAVVLILEHDYSVSESAVAVGVTRTTVHRWLAAFKAEGSEGIAPTSTPGRPSTLDEKDIKKLEKILLKGPSAAGFSNDLWTCERVGVVIRDSFGIEFHRSHVWRLLQKLGWTPQKPERRAMERDEDGIAKFVKVEWKKIVKNARNRRPP